ncbi:MAG: hypothetical protein KC544_08160 [Gemmatimonadetes bacterium]|nr:hypothetical protein [Gemmatimonadota bacterium]MCA9767983.1 hypothetical protein [Gemmatimonadota bacterium]MCB9505546.1 hypothetical protein [Gemmatimonadales bacterium]HPF61329.1 hypothetical protein [Gemmatimonadales bacterium]HRX19504.1 hypothetical protein [Gemmatimonadales bacterium]
MGDGIGDFGFWLAMGAIGCTFFWSMTPIFKAVATRITGKLPESGRVEELEQRLLAIEERGSISGEVAHQYDRLAELEERLEFAERLLAERLPDAALTSGETERG